MSRQISSFFSKKTGKQERLEFYPWPETALREALTNSLAHQDYTSPIQTTVNIYPKRIVFITPGGIPPEITLDDALTEGVSFCRNEKLADLFLRLRWMKKAGSGFSDIFRAYAPYAVKPILQHIVRIFRVELPRTDTPVDSRAGAVLSFVRAGKNGRTRADIENYLGVSRPTARKIIEGLLASGELMRIGKTRAVRYCLSSNNS